MPIRASLLFFFRYSTLQDTITHPAAGQREWKLKWKLELIESGNLNRQDLFHTIA